MAQLSDLLGGLLSEMTRARLQADLEAARVAEIYRSHPLLEEMPVPRFRLPDVTVDLPLLVDEVKPRGEKPRVAAPTRAAMARALKRGRDASALRPQLEAHSIDEEELLRAFEPTVRGRWSRAVSRDRATELNSELARELTDRLSSMLGQLDAREFDARRFREGVLEELENHSLVKSFESAQVFTTALTRQLREAGEFGAVTRISVTFKEDGFEYVKVERDDGSVDRKLIPE